MPNDRTRKELKALALGIHKGDIFTDRHIEPHDRASLLHLVFLPLALMDKETMTKLKESGPGLIYEYRHKAGPVGINRYPIFYSLGYLSKADTESVFEIIRKLEAAEKAIIEQ